MKTKNEQLRMQMLAGIITESEYKQKLNENLKIENLKIEDIINIGDSDMGPGKILLISDYKSNKMEIDRSIRNTGWEMLDIPKEELTWYKVELESGDIIWYDEDEILEYN